MAGGALCDVIRLFAATVVSKLHRNASGNDTSAASGCQLVTTTAVVPDGLRAGPVTVETGIVCGWNGFERRFVWHMAVEPTGDWNWRQRVPRNVTN